MAVNTSGILSGKTVVAVAAGGDHSLALCTDGTVAAWGLNTNGQTSVPAGLNGVVAVAAGARHSLALRSDGTVAAWGDNSAAQTNVPAGLNTVVAIAAGDNHSMALKADGTVTAWGNNGLSPGVNFLGLTGIVGIAAGYNLSAAIRQDGTVQVWGTGSSNRPPDGFQTYARPRGAVFNLQPGANVVEIRVTEPDASAVSTTTVNVTSGTPLEIWRQSRFGTAANFGNGADNADPDKDGLENLIEFAFGRDPGVPDAAALPQWQLVDDDYSLAFTRPAGVSGITYVAEYSTSMVPGRWTAATNFSTPPAYTFLAPAVAQRLYLRVRITVP